MLQCAPDRADCPAGIFYVFLTFIVESVYSVNTGTLMISSQKEEIFGVFDLVRKQEANGLQTLFATINIIAKE